jgi:hypothetical protein
MSILRSISKGSLFIAGSGCLIASGYCITMAAGFKNKKYLVAGMAISVLGSVCLNTAATMDKNDTIDQVNDHLLRNGIGTIRKEDLI